MIVKIAILLVAVSSKINSTTAATGSLLTVATAIRQEILNSNMSHPVEKHFLKHVNVSITELKGKSGISEAELIYYLLYTRKNADEPEFLATGDSQSLKKSRFKINNPTKIIIHGWRNDGDSKFVRIVKAEFLKSCDCNIIAVDWGRIAKNSIYPMVVAQTKNVGWAIGKFIQFLIDSGVPSKNIYVIGHSLGAHVAGFSQEKLKKRLRRVTGLDPAFLGFQLGAVGVLGGKGSLSADHADFVDVIHTNGGVLGMPSSIGHADFYPNGGTVQPGCSMIEISCNHAKSWKYYAEGIVNSTFPTNDCLTDEPLNVTMGYDTPSTARGSYCLTTHAKPLYGVRRN